MRISRDRMFICVAHVVAERGTCPRAKVGAVLVDKFNNVSSIGYNGAPKDEPHCEEVGCLMEDDHCKRSIHAERNAIRRAKGFLLTGPYERYNTGFTLYVTHKPCDDCTNLILRCGFINRVVFDVPYRYEGPLKWEEGGVKFEQYNYPLYQ